eukprot:Rhum_TRINITY_DN14806_c21_g1::Rhum_TRINITY_DN14806_c21_g1_i1::g.120211::m.120211
MEIGYLLEVLVLAAALVAVVGYAGYKAVFARGERVAQQLQLDKALLQLPKDYLTRPVPRPQRTGLDVTASSVGGAGAGGDATLTPAVLALPQVQSQMLGSSPPPRAAAGPGGAARGTLSRPRRASQASTHSQGSGVSPAGRPMTPPMRPEAGGGRGAGSRRPSAASSSQPRPVVRAPSPGSPGSKASFQMSV